MRNDEKEHEAKDESMVWKNKHGEKRDVEQVSYFCHMKEIDELVHDI